MDSYLIFLTVLIILLLNLLLVFPAIYLKIDLKKYTISQVTVNYKTGGFLYNTGLVISSLTLAAFWYYINNIESISYSILSNTLFLVGCISCFLGAVITMKKSVRLHTFIAKVCFTSFVFAIVIYSYSLFLIDPFVGISLMLISVLGVLGLVYLYFVRKWKGYSEVWAILFLCFWIFNLTIHII